MEDLKEGTRVRLIRDGLSTRGAVGKLATLSLFDDGSLTYAGDYLVKIDPPVDYQSKAVQSMQAFTRIRRENFEVLSERASPKFKPGDRVVEVGDPETPGTVMFSEVRKGMGTRYAVRWDNAPATGTDAIWTDDELAWWTYGAGGEPIAQDPDIGDIGIYIVCLMEGAQPLPSLQPHIHATHADAHAEAERLARKHPGKFFGVFGMDCVVQEQPTFEHEWKNLAVQDRKIEAIKSLRDTAGIGLRAAKDIVSSFMAEHG